MPILSFVECSLHTCHLHLLWILNGQTRLLVPLLAIQCLYFWSLFCANSHRLTCENWWMRVLTRSLPQTSYLVYQYAVTCATDKSVSSCNVTVHGRCSTPLAGATVGLFDWCSHLEENGLAVNVLRSVHIAPTKLNWMKWSELLNTYLLTCNTFRNANRQFTSVQFSRGEASEPSRHRNSTVSPARDVFVHCFFSGRRTHLQQCSRSLAAASA